MNRLTFAHLGPIRRADIELGDLTVLVGPQATGKSVFLQMFKLLTDSGPIRKELKRFNIDWNGRSENFLELYFGEGMSGIYDASQTQIRQDDQDLTLANVLGRGGRQKGERLFFIPAQRVLALRDGLTRPFTDYRSGDPYVVREFSEKLHQLVQSEFAGAGELFPQKKRLKSEYRKLLEEHIFAGFGLETDAERFQKRLVLSSPKGKSLPYLVWSAGQREFVPLLLGLYWLMPPTRVSRRDVLEWVVIEEPEMGLHPSAISVVMLLVLELLHRGYKVCLSTHSPHVLDIVWALQVMKNHQGKSGDVLQLFSLPSNSPINELASNVLKKKYCVYYFKRDGGVEDITGLDPAAERPEEAGWGGLTEFSGRIGDIIAEVMCRAEQ